MKKLLPYVLLTIAAFSVYYPRRYSSIRVVVSLKRQQPAVPDTSRVNKLNAACRKLWHHHIDQAATSNQQALALANQLAYPEGQAEAYRCLGVILMNRQDGTYSPHSYLQYALQLFKKLNDKAGMATTLSSLSAYYLGQNQTEKAQQALNRSEQLFKALNNQRGLAEVAHQFGELYYRLRNYAAALNQYRRALRIRQAMNDSVASAGTLNRLGDLHAFNNQGRLALTYYQNAYRIGQDYQYNQIMANATWGIGAVYQRQNQYSQALAYYQRSVKAEEDFYGQKSPWHYQQIADLYKTQGQHEKALASYKISLAAQKDFYANKRPWTTVDVYQRMADLCKLQGKYDQSLTYLHQALAIAQSQTQGLKASLSAPVFNQLAQVYLAQGRYSTALANATRSLQVANQQPLSPIVQEASLTVSLTYAALQNYAKAYAYLQQHTAIRDRLLNGELDRRALLKNELELNQKQDQVNLLWKENQVQEGVVDGLQQRNYALVAGLLLFLLLGLVLIRNNRRNQRTNRLLAEQARQLDEQRIRELEQTFEHKQAETEMAALRAQMNPHFIFNCLNSIKLYASENEAVKASDYLTKFARLIRLVLENSRSERVTLSNELEALRLYGEMEAMRFKDKLTCRLAVDPAIDADFVEIPPLLIQPYVENAIWHGLMHKEQGGTVWIRLEQPQEDLLQVIITDDGVGRAKAAELKSKSATHRKSYGMKMTGERLALINQLYHIETKVRIDDLVDTTGQPSGTQVVLQIPI